MTTEWVNLEDLHLLVIPETNFVFNHSWAVEQASTLNSFGIEVRVLFCDFNFSFISWARDKQPLQEIESNNLIYEPLKTLIPGRYRKVDSKSRNKRLKIHIEKVMNQYIERFGEPDLVHAHNGLTGGFIAQKIKELFRIPYVVTEHNSDLISDSLPKSYLELCQKVYRDSGKVIPVSRELGQALTRRLTDEKQIEVIGNVLPAVFEQQIEEVNSLSPMKAIVTVSNLIPRKRVNLIIEAYAKLSNRDSTELWIIGNGPEMRTLKEMTEKKKLENVIFFGHLSKKSVRSHLLKADLYVHASEFETFGVSLLEAAACGLPIVSVDSIGNRYIENFPRVSIVDANIDAISRGISESLALETDREEKELIQKVALEGFGPKAFRKRILEVYGQVI